MLMQDLNGASKPLSGYWMSSRRDSQSQKSGEGDSGLRRAEVGWYNLSFVRISTIISVRVQINQRSDWSSFAPFEPAPYRVLQSGKTDKLLMLWRSYFTVCYLIANRIALLIKNDHMQCLFWIFLHFCTTSTAFTTAVFTLFGKVKVRVCWWSVCILNEN